MACVSRRFGSLIPLVWGCCALELFQIGEILRSTGRFLRGDEVGFGEVGHRDAFLGAFSFPLNC